MVKEIAIGGDTGSQGALCAISDDRKFIDVIRFKRMNWYAVSTQLQWAWTMPYSVKGCCIEAARSFGTGDSALKKQHQLTEQMKNYGRLEGVLYASNVKFQVIEASVWLRHFNLYGLVSKYKRDGMSEDKARAQAKADYKGLAQRLFPDHKVLSDEADAMLIAQFVWELNYS